jgi:2,3-bisphosphoglycerate-dependent phosphoglycerate mutase
MMSDQAIGTTIFLGRHAETSAPDRFHGAESDIGLSDWGVRQAEALGTFYASRGISALYCSAMLRAVDTAARVGTACGLIPKLIPNLHERKIGILSGQSREAGWATYAETKKHWMSGDLNYSHEGGESFANIRDRVVPIIKGLVARHTGQTIVVVAHGVVIRVALLTLLEQFTPADFDQIAIDFASTNELRYEDGRWTARSLNQVVASSDSRPVA